MQMMFFFGASGESLQMTPPVHGAHVTEDTVRLLLTKNPARSFSCSWRQVHGISLERFPRHRQMMTMMRRSWLNYNSQLA